MLMSLKHDGEMILQHGLTAKLGTTLVSTMQAIGIRTVGSPHSTTEIHECLMQLINAY
jgi:hypothetical protein